jgi:peptidyl-prolyl cis-trans isomerase C
MKRLVRLTAALALGMAVSHGAAAADVTAETVVATVNGTPVTVGQMIAVRETLPEQYLQLPDDVLFDGILEQIIQQTALAATAEGKLSLRNRIELENSRRSYMAGVAMDSVANAAVTEEALQKLFDERFANAAPTKEYNAQHILVETEEEAKKLKGEIDAGADFAEIAKASSLDPGSGANGGDLGWFGPGMMVEPFETAVVGMEPGQVSDPVQTQFGWHLIKLNEVREAAGPTLEEKRGELSSELQNAAIEAHLKELTEAAEITRSVDGIDKAVLKNTDLLGK